MSIKRLRYFSILLLRLIEFSIGLMMVVSAFLHIQNQMRFYIHAAQYRVLPGDILSYFVLFAPWVLFFTGVLMLTATARPASLVVGSVLFGAFTVAQLWVMRSGAEIDCGCFGGLISEKVGLFSVLRAGLSCVLCVFLAIYHLRRGVADDGRVASSEDLVERPTVLYRD